MKNLQDLSVIVPLAPNEKAWKTLIKDLRDLPTGTEVVFSAPFAEPRNDPEYIDFKYRRKWFHGEPTVRWVESVVGRAKQMNTGARTTKKKYLWFLHSDTRVNISVFESLDEAIDRRPDSLQYFNLRFSQDGPKWMKINEKGVWLRSRLLKIPFGDQALCIKRSSFFRLGGYAEDLVFGEDHVFVWSARQNRVRLNSVGTYVETSSRKYTRGGWGRTTWHHVRLTFEQAFPQWVKLQKLRIRRLFQFIFHRPRSIEDSSND